MAYKNAPLNSYEKSIQMPSIMNAVSYELYAPFSGAAITRKHTVAETLIWYML